MKNNNIYNDPSDRACITHSWTYWDEAFSDQELQQIIEYCDTLEQNSGSVLSYSNQNYVDSIRKSKISWVYKNTETAWLFNRLNSIIQNINDSFYGFDLNGYSELQYTVYNEADLGKYDWHMDMSLNTKLEYGETRKLSLTLLLNDDFEGGEFEINTGSEQYPVKIPTKKGRAILFPSFIIHRVNPVTQGTRRSIVVWCVGPKFQ